MIVSSPGKTDRGRKSGTEFEKPLAFTNCMDQQAIMIISKITQGNVIGQKLCMFFVDGPKILSCSNAYQSTVPFVRLTKCWGQSYLPYFANTAREFCPNKMIMSCMINHSWPSLKSTVFELSTDLTRRSHCRYKKMVQGSTEA